MEKLHYKELEVKYHRLLEAHRKLFKSYNTLTRQDAELSRFRKRAEEYNKVLGGQYVQRAELEQAELERDKLLHENMKLRQQIRKGREVAR